MNKFLHNVNNLEKEVTLHGVHYVTTYHDVVDGNVSDVRKRISSTFPKGGESHPINS